MGVAGISPFQTPFIIFESKTLASFAVQHLAKGTSLKTVQKIMGHKDIRTTEEYISLANEVTKKELEENAL